MNSEPKQHLNLKSSKSMRVAIFIISAAIILYLGANFLKGFNIFGKKIYYYAIFNNVSNINKGSVVTVKGYPIGKVTAIDVISDNNLSFYVKILVSKDVNIPKDSKLTLNKQLLGSTQLEIIMGNSQNRLQNGDTLAIAVQEAFLDNIDEISAGLSSTISSIDSIALSLKEQLVHKGAIENLRIAINNITQIASDLKSSSPKIDLIVSNLAHFSKVLKDNAPKLEKIMTNVDNLSDSLVQSNIKQTVTHVDNTIIELHEILNKINQGKGDIGQLLNNESIYKNLEKATVDLDKLINDIKANPDRYINITIFGKKNKK